MIKYRLEKWNNAVVFQVLDMYPTQFEFIASNGVIIKSDLFPGINVTLVKRKLIIAVWGSIISGHDKVCVLQAFSEEERDRFYDEMIFAFDELNRNIENDCISSTK